ncbi:1-acyl-sn-glycerol-3-phosphate acyltransferase [Lentzea tibetensis]|uniref:1-acyl-sn-glycerol-3-phosphate acyltransferase n=2 Tax=Lentzea tibetensis TaxID=2591470 RepID=A0A563F2L2_9PSEU|nr:1-acyl-sn-glycerol-3-phosphate acyltransferase [Lentzea tibetensis]
MPTSPCGDGCLGGQVPTIGRVRMAFRAVFAASAILLGIPLLLGIAVLRGTARESLVRGWFHVVLRGFGARLRVIGPRRFQETRGRGVLVVSNHVSWLDELAIDAVQPIRLVAKRDIKDWPVLGRIVTGARTVYLDRERLSLLPAAVDELASALRDGAAVGIHAEGTTWCGLASGRYKPALFQSALNAGVPVRPIVLRYRVGDRATTHPAFVGSDTLVDSIRRVLSLRGLIVEVHVLDEIAPGRAANRRELAALAEAQANRLTSTEVEVEPCPGDTHRGTHVPARISSLGA